MEELILISYLNDFIFCPASIYFHNLYENINSNIYHNSSQINGRNAHKNIDEKTYSSRKDILQGIDVYCDEFKIMGKIDIYDINRKILIERKNMVHKIYDGFIFQVYAQYYALEEMGYKVEKIKIHSIQDNKNYFIKIPTQDYETDLKFRNLIKEINNFKINNFIPKDKKKCQNCIYEPLCDRSLK